MGKIRTKTVKRASRKVVENHFNKLSRDFYVNKRVVLDVTLGTSKKLKNKIAGYSTHIMRRLVKGPVRGISLKLILTHRANNSTVETIFKRLCGVLEERLETLAEFRKVAGTLQTSITNISGGLSRFSNSGLQDLQALIGDARRSVSRIDRVISDVERDPQRFLFGTTDVKTYNGRPRR